jgi:hypothetical protein
MSLYTLFHPSFAFQYIKQDREKFYFTPMIVISILVVMTRSLEIYFTHFPLATVNSRDANIVFECLSFFTPLLLWIIASYAMTTIMDGEVLLKEVFLANFYSLLPYIIVSIPLTFLSHILEANQVGLYNFIKTGMWIWLVCLIFVNLKVMNSYSIKKTILIVFLSLFTMVLICATVGLFFAITAQFIDFVTEAFKEIGLKIW